MVTNKALQIFRDTSEALSDSVFSTGDSELNQLLETAVTKYKLYDPKERKDGVEKLWDAWERLKSLEDSHVDKKKESIRLLLEKAAAADTNYWSSLNFPVKSPYGSPRSVKLLIPSTCLAGEARCEAPRLS